jgi:hypothetical protein
MNLCFVARNVLLLYDLLTRYYYNYYCQYYHHYHHYCCLYRYVVKLTVKLSKVE